MNGVSHGQVRVFAELSAALHSRSSALFATPSQLRLARFMLDLTQSDLAVVASVSRATIHRYEAGSSISPGQVKLLRIAIETAGAVIIADGTLVDGVPLYGGVALRVPRASTPVADDGVS